MYNLNNGSRKDIRKVIETLNNGEKGNTLVYSQHSSPSLDYIADRIRCRASEYSLSAYAGGGGITKPGNWVER